MSLKEHKVLCKTWWWQLCDLRLCFFRWMWGFCQHRWRNDLFWPQTHLGVLNQTTQASKQYQDLLPKDDLGKIITFQKKKKTESQTLTFTDETLFSDGLLAYITTLCLLERLQLEGVCVDALQLVGLQENNKKENSRVQSTERNKIFTDNFMNLFTGQYGPLMSLDSSEPDLYCH